MRGCLATGALLQNEILTAAQQQELVLPDGRLPESLSRDLLKVQRNLTGVASLLGQLEGVFRARKDITTTAARKPKPGATIADVILAADADAEGDD